MNKWNIHFGEINKLFVSFMFYKIKILSLLYILEA